jgi:choline dehydrogenase-like flavoprotein
MARRLRQADVVIVGLGAGGGVAALPLASAGLEVVGLEAGQRLTKRDFPSRSRPRGWTPRRRLSGRRRPDG